MQKPLIATVGLACCLGAFAVAGPITGPADELSPLSLFNRCYGTIARQRLPVGHRYYEAVKDGSMDPLEACLAVLNESKFASPSPDPAEKARVIQTFSDFHRKWFQADNYFQTLPIGELYGTVARLMHDPGEPAHYVTRALFGGAPYNSVVRETSGMIAIRDPNVLEGPVPGAGLPTTAYNNGTNPNTPYVFPVHRVGDVVNVGRAQDMLDYFGAILMPPIAGWPKPIRIHEHFGGGVLGSKSYLMLNFGRGVEDNDGGMKVPRRWSKNLLIDLLCRDVPAIRAKDAEPFVNPADPLPFRQAASCMQCHQTLDNLAGTARNLRYLAFNYDQVSFFSSIHMVSHDVANTAYFNTPPDGLLYYRSHDGSLVNQPVAGIQGVGEAIAQGEDLYVCAASRYFEFFTGLRVSLQDLGDPMTPKLTAADQAYRAHVVAAGRRFKDHQDTSLLIKELLDTEFYRSASMRRSVKVE